MLVNVLQKLPLTTGVIGAVALYTTTRIIFRNIKRLILSRRHYSGNGDTAINKLPKELLVQIFLNLEDPYQLLDVSSTCKDWSAICDRYIWKKKYEAVTALIIKIKQLSAEEPLPAADRTFLADVVTKREFFDSQGTYNAFINYKYSRKEGEESIGSLIRNRPDDLFRTLWQMITRPYPEFFRKNKSKVIATQKVFSILSLVPFMDQLIFWAPTMLSKLLDCNPWPIATQIRMVLSLLSMYPFDFLGWHSGKLPLFSRAVLAAVFYFLSIGVKGLLVNFIFAVAVGLLTLLKPVQDRLSGEFKYSSVPIILLAQTLPALYLAPVQSIGYALFGAGGLYLHHTKKFEKNGQLIMRTSLLTTFAVLVWTYAAACLPWK